MGIYCNPRVLLLWQLSNKNIIECHYIPALYKMILHSTQQWMRHNFNGNLKSPEDLLNLCVYCEDLWKYRLCYLDCQPQKTFFQYCVENFYIFWVNFNISQSIWHQTQNIFYGDFLYYSDRNHEYITLLVTSGRSQYQEHMLLPYVEAAKVWRWVFRQWKRYLMVLWHKMPWILIDLLSKRGKACSGSCTLSDRTHKAQFPNFFRPN